MSDPEKYWRGEVVGGGNRLKEKKKIWRPNSEELSQSKRGNKKVTEKKVTENWPSKRETARVQLTIT